MQARIEAAVRDRAEAGCEAMANAVGRAGEQACNGSYAEWRQSFVIPSPATCHSLRAIEKELGRQGRRTRTGRA